LWPICGQKFFSINGISKYWSDELSKKPPKNEKSSKRSLPMVQFFTPRNRALSQGVNHSFA